MADFFNALLIEILCGRCFSGWGDYNSVGDE
jgi:hypothetical protein